MQVIQKVTSVGPAHHRRRHVTQSPQEGRRKSHRPHGVAGTHRESWEISRGRGGCGPFGASRVRKEEFPLQALAVEGRARANDVVAAPMGIGGVAVLGGAVREVVSRGGCVVTELVQQVGAGGGRHAAHAFWGKPLQLGRRRAAVTDRVEERTAHV